MSELLSLVPGVGPVLAFLGGARAFVARLFAPLWGWLTADWRNGPLLFLAVNVIVHFAVIEPRLRHQRDAARDQFKAEQAAHLATTVAHANAAREAEALQAANLQRVRQEQDSISERIVDDYEARVADLRGRADRLAQRLRATTTAAGAGLPEGLPVPGPGDAAGAAAQTAGDYRLPSEGQCPAMTLEERVVASEQALQLDALIDWVEAQAKVSPNP